MSIRSFINGSGAKRSGSSLGRRRFLRGVGGAVVALPFLQSLTRTSRAEPLANPKRLVVFHHPQGTLLDDDVGGSGPMADLWTPSSTGPLTSPGQLSPILAPLATPLGSGAGAVYEKCLVLSGLSNSASEGGHAACGRSLLTGVPVIDPLTNFGYASGPSIDFVFAQHIKSEVNLPFGALNLASVSEFGGENQLHWDDQQKPIPCRFNPQTTFDELFSDLVGETEIGGPAPELSTLQKLRAERKSVLDGVLAQLAHLDARVSQEDRTVLEAHADKIRDLEKQLGSTGATVNSQCGVPELAPEDYGADFYYHEDISAKAHIDELVMALACDLTRVGTFTFSNYDAPLFPWLASEGVSIPMGGKGWHTLVHENRFDPASRDAMMKAFRWYNQMFAYLVAELDRFVEPDGTTLLDNTVVLCMSEFGNGGVHRPERLPVVLAGGLGGAFTVGRHQATNATTGNLFTTIQNAFGIAGPWAGEPSYTALSLTA